MKSTFRLLWLAAPVLALSTGTLLPAAEINSTPSETSGLTVHEWGTFTSVASEDGAVVD
jgi:hypothetical protein